jgi:hypothetical protein
MFYRPFDEPERIIKLGQGVYDACRFSGGTDYTPQRIIDNLRQTAALLEAKKPPNASWVA